MFFAKPPEAAYLAERSRPAPEFTLHPSLFTPSALVTFRQACVEEALVSEALDVEALAVSMPDGASPPALGTRTRPDACQDVFVRLLEHQRALVARYPSSLLYRIATNVCLDMIRNRTRRPVDDDEIRLAAIACAEVPGAGSEARLLLDRVFGRHPESSRTMAVLHYVDGLTLEEVAAETRLSVSGVRKRLRKLRETLTEMER